MKKFLAILFTLILSMSIAFTVYADEDEVPNILPAQQSTFEGVSELQKTGWFRLTNAYGDSSGGSNLYNGISIKESGGRNGSSYLSTNIEQSWYSPAINLYPYFKEAGAGTYVLSFWYKSDGSFGASRFLVRGLTSDIHEEGAYSFSINPAGSGNQYAIVSGESTAPDAAGWRCFISEPIEIDDAQLQDAKHNWWFCMDQFKAPLTLDIDDFTICLESDFEYPDDGSSALENTDIPYIDDAAKENAFPAYKESAADNDNTSTDTEDATATPAPTADGGADNTEANADDDGMKVGIVIIFAVVALVVGAAASFAVVVIIKKKK